jgi:hypothetical protein
VPTIPVPLIKERIGADQAFAGEETKFRLAAVCRQVAILGHEDVRWPTAPERTHTKKPVGVWITAGHCDVSITRTIPKGKAGNERKLFVHVFASEKRELWHPLESIPARRWHMQKSVGAPAPFLAGANQHNILAQQA